MYILIKEDNEKILHFGYDPQDKFTYSTNCYVTSSAYRLIYLAANWSNE